MYRDRLSVSRNRVRVKTAVARDIPETGVAGSDDGVLGGLSATLPLPDYGRVARHSPSGNPYKVALPFTTTGGVISGQLSGKW